MKIWAGMINMVMKDPMSIALALFEYHWFASYLGTPVAVDRSNLGRRGELLKSDIKMWGAITHWAEWQIQTQLRADARIGGNEKLSKRIVLFDDDHGADDGRLPDFDQYALSDDPGLHVL